MWLFACGTLIFASYWSVRLAFADFFYRRNTIPSLTTAVGLASGDAEYQALLSEHLEGVGADPDSGFLRAAALSPMDSRYWIRLGFSAESKGNYESAEKYLLRAASVNRKFDPAWALMNFYFRRGDAKQFWIWADKAMAVSYGDATAVYRLFWDMSDDAQFIRSHVPSKPSQLMSYLSFVMVQHKPEAAAGAAHDLALIADSNQLGVLLHYCGEASLSDTASALDVWNVLCTRRLLPVAPIDPANRSLIADPTFKLWPPREGFGWHIDLQDEVLFAQPDDSQGLHIRLSGKQPDESVLLDTLLLTFPGRHYRLLFEVNCDAGANTEGISWSVLDSGRLSAQTSLYSARGSSPLEFQADMSPARLLLTYKRPLGSLRAQGGFTIRSVRGEAVK
jgi:hypothetical protein